MENAMAWAYKYSSEYKLLLILGLYTDGASFEEQSLFIMEDIASPI